MNRRTFLGYSAASGFTAFVPKEAVAVVPLLLWIWRAATLLRGQALRVGARSLASNGARRAVSSATLARRASRAASALRTVTVVSLGAVATDEVLARVQGTPEDSILRWTLAYYSVLTQSDADAAMGMWVDPPDPVHFLHLNRTRPSYKVTRLQQEGGSTARAWVLAQNPGEQTTSHVLDIDWRNTEFGQRISGFKSIG